MDNHMNKSKCIRVYIDSLTHAIDTVEGFKESEVDAIKDGLDLKKIKVKSLLQVCEYTGRRRTLKQTKRKILDGTKQLIKLLYIYAITP